MVLRDRPQAVETLRQIKRGDITETYWRRAEQGKPPEQPI